MAEDNLSPDEFLETVEDGIAAAKDWEGRTAEFLANLPKEATCISCYMQGVGTIPEDEPQHIMIFFCPNSAGAITISYKMSNQRLTQKAMLSIHRFALNDFMDALVGTFQKLWAR